MYKTETSNILAVFEHKITVLKNKVKELQDSQNESHVIKVRNKVIEEMQKDNKFYKDELQRVEKLYIKHKNNISKYKKKVQDLESTNQVYFEKIAEVVRYNEKLIRHNHKIYK